MTSLSCIAVHVLNLHAMYVPQNVVLYVLYSKWSLQRRNKLTALFIWKLFLNVNFSLWGLALKTLYGKFLCWFTFKTLGTQLVFLNLFFFFASDISSISHDTQCFLGIKTLILHWVLVYFWCSLAEIKCVSFSFLDVWLDCQ